MKPRPRAEDDHLIFDWTSLHEAPNLLLPAFFLLSVLLHAASFYLFQIAYPPTVLLRPPAARVQILDPQSPEHWRLALWLEGQDPSLVASHAQNNAGNHHLDRSVTYTPTYSSSAPTPISPHLTFTQRQLPPVEVSGPLTPSPASPTPATAESQQAIPTSSTLSPSLAARHPQELPAMPPLSLGARGLQNSRFSLSVAPSGRVAHIFCDTSSGNADADNHTALYLKRLIFEPAAKDAGLQWGTVAIHWGNDFSQTAEPTNQQ